MEILHTNAKRTILAVLDDSEAGTVYCKNLAVDFKVVRTNSTEEALKIMYDRFADMSAVIVDIDMAQENDFAFLHAASQERLFDTIPILVASRRATTPEDMRCLDEGALDFILPPHHRGLTKRRIENALKVKRGAAFYEIEAILRELPSNIFLKDAEGRYVFMTHYWHHLDRGDDPNWTIRGKTDLEIRKDRENALKAVESDREILRTGKGMSYVLESNVDGIRDFKEMIKRPVFDSEGNVTGIVALINDVTETELLKMELEKRARTDELTGLGNRRAFDEFVKEIPQTTSFPIAIISADCDYLKMINDTYGHLVGDEYIRMASVIFKVSLPQTTHSFRTGGDEFIAFLPGVGKDEADKIVETMRAQSKLFKLPEQDVSISYGTAEITGPYDNVLYALGNADRAMYDDKAARKRARGE